MKRGIAIAFISLYLLASTEMHEFLRLPLLVEHFIVHNQQVDISLSDFIILHYFSGDIRDADYADDMKLPFKNHLEVSLFPTICLIMPATFVKPANIISTSVEYNNYFHSFMPSAMVEHIWQPPKI